MVEAYPDLEVLADDSKRMLFFAAFLHLSSHMLLFAEESRQNLCRRVVVDD